MALLNTQYDRLMRHYDEVRERNRHIAEDRLAEIRAAIPGFSALESTITHLYAEIGRCRIRGTSLPPALERDLADCRARRTALLTEHGYPADYLEPIYDCPDCRDTGYADGVKCHCFRRLEASLLRSRFTGEENLGEDTFAHFKIECYSDTIEQGQKGPSPREVAREAYRTAILCAERIGSRQNDLLIYGHTGVGKTFLSRCIINKAREDGHTALYFSAADIFDLMADAAFNRSPDSGAYADMVRHCDLLVIDDLGTERRNNLVESELFRLINNRQLEGLTTVISTNLGPAEIAAAYSERVFSRIISHCRIIRLIGDDIRIKNKLSGGHS